jgi:hypothetical protein
LLLVLLALLALLLTLLPLLLPKGMQLVGTPSGALFAGQGCDHRCIIVPALHTMLNLLPDRKSGSHLDQLLCLGSLRAAPACLLLLFLLLLLGAWVSEPPVLHLTAAGVLSE